MKKNEPPRVAVIADTSASSIRRFSGPEHKATIIDPIDLSPDVQGKAGRAWICDTANVLKLHKIKPEQDACIANWLIEAPAYHPIWHSYILTAIHLRPLPDMEPPIMHKDGATHELWLTAVNPETKSRLSAIKGQAVAQYFLLTPDNFAAQFIEDSDQTAFERIKSTVQMICDGKLSPDTDAMYDWGKLFGLNMLKDEYR